LNGSSNNNKRYYSEGKQRLGLTGSECRVSDRILDIYFSPIKLAQLDTHEYRLIHLP
jgi:hypothetical protein